LYGKRNSTEKDKQISEYRQTLKSIKDKVGEILKTRTLKEPFEFLQQINSMLKEDK
jgi:hypothetical protein